MNNSYRWNLIRVIIQGDKIWSKFRSLGIVYIVHYLKKDVQKYPTFLGYSFRRLKLCYNFDKKWIGPYFSQTHPVTLGPMLWFFKYFRPKNLNIGFWGKRQFFRRKLAKISENCDHNIDPLSYYTVLAVLRFFPNLASVFGIFFTSEEWFFWFRLPSCRS
jgi:hypothetical protein